MSHVCVCVCRWLLVPRCLVFAVGRRGTGASLVPAGALALVPAGAPVPSIRSWPPENRYPSGARWCACLVPEVPESWSPWVPQFCLRSTMVL